MRSKQTSPLLLTLLSIELDKPMAGEPELSKVQAIIARLVDKTLEGDARMSAIFFKLATKLEKEKVLSEEEKKEWEEYYKQKKEYDQHREDWIYGELGAGFRPPKMPESC